MHKTILLFPLLFFSCLSDSSKSMKDASISFVWELQDSLSGASFRGISVPDEKTIWVSGSGGTILRSVNGGESWRVDSIVGYGDTDFRDVVAFDASRAIVMGVGNPAVILKTEDGGQSWSRVFYKKLEGIFLNSMTFPDEKNGFVVGDPVDGRFYLLKTSNRGETWDELDESSRPPAEEGEYMFAASGTCITGKVPSYLWFVSGGATARVFRSADNGTHWEIKQPSFMSGKASAGIFSVLFTDNKTGYCIGGDYSKPDSTGITFLYTTNGGKNWLQPSHQPQGYRSCIGLFKSGSNQFLVSVGRGGSSFLKADSVATASWKQIVGPGFYTLDTDPDGSVAWAAGKDGSLGRLLIQNKKNTDSLQ